MSFSPSWLAEREPADVAARASDVSRLVQARVPEDRPVRVIDLGSGTGSNARYLIPHLPREQDWVLIDGDRVLLELAPSRMEGWSRANGYRFDSAGSHFSVTSPDRRCRFTTRVADLNAIVKEPLAAVEIVTASALLDLVSEAWLGALAARCADAGVFVLFALTYDGRMECAPEDPEDRDVRELVNRHQRSDKGFGAALGPEAVLVVERLFAARDYDVRRSRSDWVLADDQASLQRQLIDGWAAAAIELAPARRAVIDAWRSRRLLAVDARQSRIVVGHEDVAAWPLK
jgi:hypothetical protein